jgi:GT2 family glycosyltransferase
MIASVIVNFRTAHLVERLLASGELDGTRVVIVDNGSQPDAVTTLCERHDAEALLLPTNRGFAAGVNAAIRRLPAATSEVLLVNPDVTLPLDGVAQLHKALQELRADAVSPRLMIAGTGEIQGANGGGPFTLGSLGLYYWFGARLFRTRHGLFLNRPQIRSLVEPTQLAWLAMTCLLLRHDAIDRFGLLPEEEFMYGEDVAWGTLASSLGARFFLVPAISVEHVGGASGGGGIDSHLGAVCRLARRRMPRGRSTIACFIVWSGLRLRRLARLT